ncbi:MAG: GH32 C-terminal domain-containing protein [Phycisphaeraceae bacterium]|nr:GH32 C-terminal domain-containing protein [Phycisphaeraceae bacterium]
MKTVLAGFVAGFTLLCACGVSAETTDKTLVAWVMPSSLTPRGGSVLTIQSGDQFDGIVFGELQSGKWMAGSDFYNRTEKTQSGYGQETVPANTLVQMAIVYQGDRIRILRNGETYAAYQAQNIDLLGPENSIAVFGLRHVGAGSGHVSCVIEDARIYPTALTVQQIKSLQPNRASEIKPVAWWDFEGKTVKDRAGRFPFSRMKGGAALEQGRLVLGAGSVLVAAATDKDAKVATRDDGSRAPVGPFVTETPAMPKEVPAHWLTYHLAHPGPGVGMPGDPNPAFFYKGRYHLHYIYKNKHGFAFAHVSSADMVTWQWHPTVLVGPNTGHGMFSGTGFFTKEGQPAMIYHGQGAGNNYLAFGLDDDLDQWTTPRAVKPLTQSGQVADIRMWDPDCWLNGDTYYAISGGSPPHLMKSNDLETWSYLGLLLHPDMPDLGVSKNEDISCANMFKIGDKWMLLCISHQMGCRYYLGDFKDEQYLPEFHAMMNWKDWHFFAPESLLTPDGRRVMWAWCRVEGAQSAIQSLPRELSLPADGVLRIQPLRELETLRGDEIREGRIRVKRDSHYLLKDVAGDTVELSINIKPTDATEYGVSVFCDAHGNGFPITIKPESRVLAMGDIEPPFELKPGEDLNLRIFLDRGMVEVFVNGRQAAVYMHPHDKDDVHISLFSKGSDIMARVKAWPMKSIYADQ